MTQMMNSYSTKHYMVAICLSIVLMPVLFFDKISVSAQGFNLNDLLPKSSGDNAINGYGQNVTLADFLFKSRDSFKNGVLAFFDKHDKDHDGKIKIDEFVSEFATHKGSIFTEEIGIKILRLGDKDNDGYLSYEEFLDIVDKGFQTQLVLNSPICDTVAKIMRPCSRSSSYRPFTDASSTFAKSDMSTLVTNCKLGLTQPQGFPSETCIMNVKRDSTYKPGSKDSCTKVKKCVSEYYGRTPSQVKLTDIAYIEKSNEISHGLGFISYLISCVLSFAMYFPPGESLAMKYLTSGSFINYLVNFYVWSTSWNWQKQYSKVSEHSNSLTQKGM